MEEQPQRRPVSKGTCSFCGGAFSKGSMARHLAACPKRAAAMPAPAGGRQSRQKGFHLVVAGRYRPEYWLHLDVPASRTLEDLDDFLRDIWLECCGHLSAFRIGGRHFLCGRYGDFRDLDDENMDIPLRKVLRPGMSFTHEYDFGSTTELTLRVLSELVGTAADGSIRVLARNQPPLLECQTCGQPATQLCSHCIYEGEGWLCDECGARHECGEEMLLPIANSPRVGVCGYAGPAEPTRRHAQV